MLNLKGLLDRMGQNQNQQWDLDNQPTESTQPISPLAARVAAGIPRLMAQGEGSLPPGMAMVSGMISSAAEKYVPMMSDEYLMNMLIHIRNEISSWIEPNETNSD